MTSGIPAYLLTYNCGKSDLRGDEFRRNLVRVFPEEMADIYVFGLQEVCSIMDGSFYKQANKVVIAYNELFLNALGEKYGEINRFQTIAINHVGAIGIIAITPYRLKFSKVRVGGSGCGYGNSSMKGAAGIRVKYQDEVELTFANAHLAAFEGANYYLKRNDNLNTLVRSLDFGDGHGVLKNNNHTFIMGDLNYRTTDKFIANSPESNELREENDNYELLVKTYDELSRGRRSGDIFAGFSEAPIKFRPTYKFNVGSNIYSLKRSPAWCDRILFQSTYEEAPIIQDYNSIKTIRQSDHEPVCLHIIVPFKSPKPILSPTGFLQVLQSEHNSKSLDIEETIYGPTQIYMKPTSSDYFIQNYVRTISDKTIGYGLFFGTTNKGRAYLLLAVVSLWLYFIF